MLRISGYTKASLLSFFSMEVHKLQNTPAYKNKDLSFEERAKDLVSRMTLEEKIMEMLHTAPGILRLDVKPYNWWSEALHGVARAGTATIFPQAIGLAATFDEALLFKIADVISTEGRAKFHEFQRKEDYGIYKGLTFWSPNINIFRDPRWGRGQESYGEDPYLTGRLGVAFVKGIQGDDSKYLKAAACAKHFAVHSGPEADRHEFDAIASEKDMWETYLPAFYELIKEADVEAVMGAYNRTNGEPCCGSKALLVDILRQKWDFKGHVVSDCWAIKDFHETHKVTKTPAESVALAVNMGCDLNCGNLYPHLLDAIKEGLVTEETIDTSLTRLILTKMKLGLFDDPKDVPFSSIPYELNDCDEHKEFALDVSKKSLVLLKNQDKLLPLNKEKIKSIAVIGPNADSRAALLGNYAGTSSGHITVLEGIRKAVSKDTRVYYAEGCHLYKERYALPEIKSGFAEALSAAERSDVVVMCMGLDASIEGEQGDVSNDYASGDKLHLNLPGLQQALLEEVQKVGKPIILVLLAGSALAVTWADEHIPAIIQGWYPGAEGGSAIASLIFGDYSPSGKLPVTFYRSTEELPDFTDYSMENRTYRYMKNEALYPFGYGLSFTNFEYSNLKLSSEKISVGDSINCTLTVKNAGTFDSDEIVQLYLKDTTRADAPHWQLAGTKRVSLKQNQEQEVSFTVTARQMAHINDKGECLLGSGKFTLFVGGSQPDERSKKLTGSTPIQTSFEVVGEMQHIPY